MDTLERERQLNNLIDRVDRLMDRVRRLEEQLLKPGQGETRVFVPQPDTGALWELTVEESSTVEGMAWLVMEEME